MRVLSFPSRSSARRNPYLGLLYGALGALGVEVEDYTRLRALRDRYDIWHVHWPELVFGTRGGARGLLGGVVFLLLIGLQRARGARLVWTVHNLAPHDARRRTTSSPLWRAYLHQVDAAISMTDTGVGLIRERFPELAGKPVGVARHGHLRPVHPPPLDRAAARAALGLPRGAPVLAFVGLVRPYKNVLGLLEAFRGLPDDAHLLVAGEPRDAGYAARVAAAAARDPRVHLRLDYLEEREVVEWVSAAELIVLPFHNVFNSGSALLALSLDRPILVPATPTMEELREQVGERWVQTYEGTLDSAILAAAFAAACAAGPGHVDLDDFEWAKAAERTLALYRETLPPVQVAQF